MISMIIIFIFFGDYKASLIVGSSIPTSILVSLILMTSAGFPERHYHERSGAGRGHDGG